jgi:gamma-glutamyltranspeptidase/glutathione hydrolase
MLKMVERFPLGSDPDWGFQSAKATHVMLEAMRLGFRDQDLWIGDNRPGFYTDMPLAGLLSSDYLAQRSALIDPLKRIVTARPGNPRGVADEVVSTAVEAEPVSASPDSGGHTSHFSIVDRWGNVVSVTTTLGDGLGSTIAVPGYGFMLNNASGRNVNTAPQARTAKNVIDGGTVKTITDPGANDAAGGKRAMGNVAPVIVLKDGEPVLVTGGAGGAQIMPAVYQVITNVLDFSKTLQEALDAPRVGGNQTTVLWNAAQDPVTPWFGGAAAFPGDTLSALIALGHPVRRAGEPYPWVGGTQSIAVDPETFSLSAAADPRGQPAAGAPIVVAPQ